MQVCTLLQTDNHASTPPLSFLQAGCPSCSPTNSVKALKAKTHENCYSDTWVTVFIKTKKIECCEKSLMETAAKNELFSSYSSGSDVKFLPNIFSRDHFQKHSLYIFSLEKNKLRIKASCNTRRECGWTRLQNFLPIYNVYTNIYK